MNNEIKLENTVKKKTFVAKLGELSRNSSEGIEENHLKRHLIWSSSKNESSTHCMATFGVLFLHTA